MNLTRQELLDLVWSVPMIKLAANHSIRAADLAAIVRSAGIPTPPSGYWTKYDLGIAPAKPVLPSAAHAVSEMVAIDIQTLQAQESQRTLRRALRGTASAGKIGPTSQSTDTSTDAVPLNAADQLESESPTAAVVSLPHLPDCGSPEAVADMKWMVAMLTSDEVMDFEVNSKPPRLHRLVTPYAKQFKDAARRVAESRASDRRRNTDYAGPNPILEIPGAQRMRPLRIALASSERAVVLMTAILTFAERRGFGVEMEERESAFQLNTRGKSSILVRLLEKTENYTPPGTDYERKNHTGTGRLRICVGSGTWKMTEIVDKSDSPVETQLRLVFATIYRETVKELATIRQRDQWRAEHEASSRRAAEERRRREEDLQRAEELRARRLTFSNEAADWQQANALRAYAAHLTKGGVELPAATIEWIQEALEIADALDPSVRRLSKQ